MFVKYMHVVSDNDGGLTGPCGWVFVPDITGLKTSMVNIQSNEDLNDFYEDNNSNGHPLVISSPNVITWEDAYGKTAKGNRMFAEFDLKDTRMVSENGSYNFMYLEIDRIDNKKGTPFTIGVLTDVEAFLCQDNGDTIQKLP